MSGPGGTFRTANPFIVFSVVRKVRAGLAAFGFVALSRPDGIPTLLPLHGRQGADIGENIPAILTRKPMLPCRHIGLPFMNRAE